MLARGIGVEAAAAHLGHTSKAFTEAHYFEPDRAIDFGPAEVLRRTLDPDGTLLARPGTDEEEEVLDAIDPGVDSGVDGDVA